MARIQILHLPAAGYDFGLVVDQCDDYTTDWAAFGKDLGATATLVTSTTVEVGE